MQTCATTLANSKEDQNTLKNWSQHRFNLHWIWIHQWCNKIVMWFNSTKTTYMWINKMSFVSSSRVGLAWATRVGTSWEIPMQATPTGNDLCWERQHRERVNYWPGPNVTLPRDYTSFERSEVFDHCLWPKVMPPQNTLFLDVVSTL
jgi:hypothetical protein